MTRLLTLSLFIVIVTSPVYASERVKEGAPAPTFLLLDEKNKKIDLSTVMDKPTVIYFTHNACHYCTQIIAHLKRAEQKFSKKKLRIIGINVMARDKELIKAYKEELGFTFPMFAGNREDLLRTYKINYVPVLIFIDAKKIVRKVVGHYIHEPELHGIIKNILSK